MCASNRVTFLLLVAVFIVGQVVPVSAGETDPNPAWPLCGRIDANPPQGWTPPDGCPAERFGNPAYSDEPLSSSFGPRPLYSENNRFDFHRGIDIATPIGTPFFAIADGLVRIAGEDPGYSDPLVSLRHYRPGTTSCSSAGCYNSNYLHISSWVVSAGQSVSKGQLLGYTGSSGSGFEHLHFEVRDAPDFDPFSSWSRDAVHPLGVLPYAAANDTTILFNNVDFSDPEAGRANLTLGSNRYDLVSVSLTLLDSELQPIPQSGDQPNARGYHVLPSFFDMELANFSYSHKNSSGVPWSSFAAGGVNECPYHADHGASYDANVHLDALHPADFHDGLFNGIHLQTLKYWPSDVSDYWLRLEFQALQGPAACIEATAGFASGDSATAQWGDCAAGSNQPPVAAFSWACSLLDCSFDASSSVDPDGSIANRAWDFGDGGQGNGTSLSHTFPAAGDWLVSLTVTDDDASSDTLSQWVSVTAPAPAITIDLSTNSKRNRVNVNWGNANGSKVRIYRNGAQVANTANDGNWTDRNVIKGTTYSYQVCESTGSPCSAEQSFTL